MNCSGYDNHEKHWRKAPYQFMPNRLQGSVRRSGINSGTAGWLWDIDTMDFMSSRPVTNPDESVASRKISKSLMYENDRSLRKSCPMVGWPAQFPKKRPLLAEKQKINRAKTIKRPSNSRGLAESHQKIFGEEVHSSSVANGGFPARVGY